MALIWTGMATELVASLIEGVNGGVKVVHWAEQNQAT